MAISANASILAMLKVYYKKEGIQNLLFRNSPLLKKMNKERVEGKEQRFAAMYSRGGAAGGDFTAAKTQAATVAQTAEFIVTPGQLFSVYTMNAKEVAASRSNAGAYMRVGGAKMFAASESFRKTLAAALYGSGYGEICAVPTGGWTLTSGTDFTATLPEDAIMKIDVGSKLVVKATAATAETSAKNTLTVKKIDGTSVVVTPGSTANASAGDIVCIAGSMSGSAASAWTTYIATSFFGVDRSVNPDRLAGAFVDATSATGDAQKKSHTVTTLIKKLRRQGSLCDMIVMNDDDFLEFAREIETSNTYFTQTSTKEKKNATIGFSDISAAFSTNYVENIIDDPYCVKGRFYVLSSDAVEFWGYTNVDKALNDGVEGNNAGKQDLTFKTEDYCAAKWDASTNTFTWGLGGSNADWTFMAADGISGDLSSWTLLHLHVSDFTNASAKQLKVVFKKSPSSPEQHLVDFQTK